MSSMSAAHRATHWNQAYADGGDDVSWFQASPIISLEMIDTAGTASTDAIVDVGGGASRLADALVDRQFRDVTVVDVSDTALDVVRTRLPDDAPVELIVGDLLEWVPRRRYRLWHDRAVLHFLTDDDDMARYRQVMNHALEPGGAVIIATFDADGPDRCSGLDVRRHSADELVGFLGADFDLVEHRREVHSTPWGSDQPFTWILAKHRDPRVPPATFPSFL